MGQEPVEKEIPPDWEDFPNIALDAMNTFSMLGDRVASEIGYIGKDFTNLNTYIEVYGIEDRDKDLILEILTYLESRAIKQSQEQLKREREKLKRKH